MQNAPTAASSVKHPVATAGVVEGSVKYEVYSGNPPAASGFASQGSVLSARGTRGLPLVSMNGHHADVEFLRKSDHRRSSCATTSNRQILLWCLLDERATQHLSRDQKDAHIVLPSS